jgi:hypothetical protein
MYKNTKNLFTFLIIALFFASCKKEDKTGDVKIETFNNEVVLKLTANKIPLSTLALSPNDKVEEYINQKNIELCEVLKPLFLKPDFNRFVVETAKKDKGRVYYKQIFEAFPETKALFKHTILGKRENASLNTRNSDWYDFERNGYYYDAMLYVPNYDNALPTNQVVLSPEIQSPQQETGQGDVYFAWYGQGQVIVNEGESQNMSVPVVMTSLADVTPYPEPTTDEPSSTPVPKWSRSSRSGSSAIGTRGGVVNPQAIFIPKSKLNYNYDGGSDPDLYFVGCFIANDGQSSNYSRRGEYKIELSDVQEECTWQFNNADNMFTSSSWATEGSLYNQSFLRDKKYFFNAWERDWGSNNKPLGFARYAGLSYEFEGVRKFTDEWYMYEPNKNITVEYALPIDDMINEPGTPFFPLPDLDLFPGSNNPCTQTFGVKAEFSFSRGIKN